MDKRWILTLALSVLLALPSLAQTPTFIQAAEQPVLQSNSAIPDLFQCHCVKFKVPNGLAATGNYWVMGLFWGDSTSTLTLTTDAAGSTFTEVGGTPFRDGVNGNSIDIWIVKPGASATLLTATFSVATLPSHVQGLTAEFNNIAGTAPIDVSCSGAPTATTTMNCSAPMTTTQAGDLIFHFGSLDNGAVQTSWTAGTGFTLLAADRMSTLDNYVAQVEIQASAGSINPSLTSGASGTQFNAAVALKAASAGGTLGAGMKVLATMGNADDTVTGRASPFTIQAPCPASTNLLILKWIGASGDLNSVSGSLSGAFTSAGTGLVNGASGTVHIYFKGNASTGPTETLTLTTAAVTSLGDQAIIECVRGAATSPLDFAIACPAGSTLTGNTCQRTGTQATTGAFNVAGITPSTSNGVISWVTGQSSNNSDAPSASPQTAYDPPDENNSTWFFYNPDTASRQGSVTGNVGAPGAWASTAVAFTAPAGGGGGGAGAPSLLLKGVGP